MDRTGQIEIRYNGREMRNKATYILMFFAFFVYSLSGVLSKFASKFEMFSLSYLLCFCGIIVVLGVYAILWQQILKRIELSVAMSYKPVVLAFGTLWAVFFFGETVDVKFLVALALIVTGLVVMGNEK